MALTNRLGVVNWTLENDNITLAATPYNQKMLEDATGMGFFEYLSLMDSTAHNPLVVLANVFHHCQVSTQHSVDDIYGCFFGDLSAYGDTFPALQEKFINHLTGNKESKIIADAHKAEEKKVNA